MLVGALAKDPQAQIDLGEWGVKLFHNVISLFGGDGALNVSAARNAASRPHLQSRCFNQRG